MNTSYLSSPDFTSTTLHVWTFFEIPVHILGFYCILFQTPESMKSVKWSMLNLHFWCVLMDIVFSVMTRPYLLVPALAAVPQGLFTDLGISPVIQGYFAITSFAAVGMSIVSIFENRYFLLFANNSWWRYARYPVLTYNYFLAFTCYIPPLLSLPDQKIAIEVLEKNYPFIPISTYSNNLFILSLDYSTLLVYFAVPVLSGITESFTLGFLLYWNMKKNVRELTLSPKTYELQKKFLQAVLIQIATPFLIFTTPVLYFGISILTNYYNQVINNFCVLSLAFHGWMSTVIMLLIHTPYRNFLGNRFGFFKKREDVIISIHSTC